MDRATLLDQARGGDAAAIAALISHGLRPCGIRARAVRSGERLTLWLEAAAPIDRPLVVAYLQRGLEQLQPQGLVQVTIYGSQSGSGATAWSTQLLPLAGRPPQPSARPASPEAMARPVPPATARSPLVIKVSDFEPLKTAGILFVAVYGFLGSCNPGLDGPFIWLHYPDLAIHETGHLLFSPFGRFLMILGGSLTQILFPAVFTAYFYVSRQTFSSALTLFWTGQNFMDVGIYMADAPYRVLPLTVDDPNAHDWYNLFNQLNCMDQAGLIAGATHWIGVALYGLSVAAGLYFIRQDTLRLRAQLAQLNGQLS
jgi:hypothetical protein